MYQQQQQHHLSRKSREIVQRLLGASSLYIYVTLTGRSDSVIKTSRGKRVFSPSGPLTYPPPPGEMSPSLRRLHHCQTGQVYIYLSSFFPSLRLVVVLCLLSSRLVSATFPCSSPSGLSTSLSLSMRMRTTTRRWLHVGCHRLRQYEVAHCGDDSGPSPGN